MTHPGLFLAPPILGYCTNIHAGIDLPAIEHNLQSISQRVQQQCYPDLSTPLPIGLWIPDSAAQQLDAPDALGSLAQCLEDCRLLPFTINGFPFANFHQPVVKHNVYLPGWWQDERRDYTIRLTSTLSHLLRNAPSTTIGSISTLPLGWPSSDHDHDRLLQQQSAANLRIVADHLARLEAETGRRIVIAIEPEPGCMFDRASHIVDFFQAHLNRDSDRRYLTVCHDICHSAVMFEPQSEALQAYADGGVTIGKVQISSAIDLPLASLDRDQKEQAFQQLRAFAEDRYLHQTSIRAHDHFQLIEDLPTALDQTDQLPSDAHLRVHFHVPIHIEEFGHLGTTKSDVDTCIALLCNEPPSGLQFTGHFEVETYAWSVLPESLKTTDTATNIANEWKSVRSRILD